MEWIDQIVHLTLGNVLTVFLCGSVFGAAVSGFIYCTNQLRSIVRDRQGRIL